MRDVVLTVFADSVKFDGSYVKTDYTIRELTDLYLEYQPWGDLGIDIGLGLPIDKRATPNEYMFLPDYVESGFAHATILQGDKTVPLVKRRISTYESQPEKFSKGVFQPFYVFSVFFILALLLSYRDYKRMKLTHAFDVTFFSILGILGLSLLLLWTATDHNDSANNMNILWALPTHLIAVVAFIRQPKWLEKYFLVVAIITASLLIVWPVLPQQLHFALIPIVLTIALRAGVQYWIRKKTKI
jgi:hypothetical protein